jgi:hypothetical protein
MSISVRTVGLIAVAVILAACSGPNAASAIGEPSAANNAGAHSKFAHLAVAPGRAGKLAILNTFRPRLHRVHHDFVATRPCTYLSDNFSGDVRLYNKDLSLAGDFGTNMYGWGVYASNSAIYIGKNDGSGDLDVYTPCTNHFAHSLTGLGKGGFPYSIASSRTTRSLYATDWPLGDIQYWPNGSTTAQSVTDPGDPFPYFIDVDSAGNVWISGYDYPGYEETVDECVPDFSSCTIQIVLPGGFPGGIQVDQNETVYIDDQTGTLRSFDCSSNYCNFTGSFVYNNGTNPVDYTALALDKYKKHLLWAANVYSCGGSSSVCSDGQSQTLPLYSATLGASTPQWDNAELLGIARYKPDSP